MVRESLQACALHAGRTQEHPLEMKGYCWAAWEGTVGSLLRPVAPGRLLAGLHARVFFAFSATFD